MGYWVVKVRTYICGLFVHVRIVVYCTYSYKNHRNESYCLLTFVRSTGSCPLTYLFNTISMLFYDVSSFFLFEDCVCFYVYLTIIKLTFFDLCLLTYDIPS